jgi:hypothetical protein
MSNMDVGSSLRWLSASTMHNHIILTPHVTHNPKILPKLGVYNCVRLTLYANRQHINVLKHFEHV